MNNTTTTTRSLHTALLLLAVVTIAATAAVAAPKTTSAAAVLAKKAAAKEKVRPPPRPVAVDPSLPPQLAAALNEAMQAEQLDNVDVGFVAMDIATGKILAESGADTLINPASNAKLITSAAALATLKPEFRFKTEYAVQGQLKDGVLTGNLVVKGYGDPSIVNERLMKIANELYLFGVEKITGAVIVDDTYFDGVEEARGWEMEDAPDRAYAAPVSATQVNYNSVAVYIRPASTAGQPAVVVVDPPSERVVLKGTVTTEAVGRGVTLVSQKDDEGVPKDQPHNGTLLTIEGSVGLRDAPARIYRRVYDPARHFGSVLTGYLQRRGVKMRHNVVKGPMPPGSKLIMVDKSPPLKEIVDDLNHYSNNIIAETLIKTMGAESAGAPGTFDNGLAVARTWLETRVGLAPGSYIFGNGSGLNDVNRFTARQLAQLVRTVSSDYEIATEWFTSLAVAGSQGTISHRMKDTPAKRRLRAKTGTLRGVSALSGTVARPNGEIVVFSVLTQGFKTGAGPMWKVQNAVGTALASDGLYDPNAKDEVDEGEAVSSTITPTTDPNAPVLEIAGG